MSRRSMSRQAAVAVLLVAALAVGRAIESSIPRDDAADQPFERVGVVGEPVDLRWGTIEAGPVDGSTRISAGGSGRMTSGVYLVVPITFTAAHEAQTIAYVAVRDTHGRTFRSGSDRNPYHHGGPAQPGVPRQLTAAVEVPVDAVPGAQLIVAVQPNDDNHRRDDMAVIDLDLTGADAEAWSSTDDVLTVPEPVDGPVGRGDEVGIAEGDE